jgi:hypothetical protein
MRRLAQRAGAPPQAARSVLEPAEHTGKLDDPERATPRAESLEPFTRVGVGVGVGAGAGEGVGAGEGAGVGVGAGEPPSRITHAHHPTASPFPITQPASRIPIPHPASPSASPTLLQLTPPLQTL